MKGEQELRDHNLRQAMLYTPRVFDKPFIALIPNLSETIMAIRDGWCPRCYQVRTVLAATIDGILSSVEADLVATRINLARLVV